MKTRWVPLAEIARPHGVKGEIRLKLFNKSSDVLLDRDEVLVRLKDGTEHEVSIERARRADDAILMKLYSIDDRNRADELRGALVCVKRGDFPTPEEGEFYTVDVEGAEVRLAGARIGEVAEIIAYPTLEVMVVRTDDGLGDWEVPLTEAYIAKVDTDARVVDVLMLDDLERLPGKKKKEKPPRHNKRDNNKDKAGETAPSSSGGDQSVDGDEGSGATFPRGKE